MTTQRGNSGDPLAKEQQPTVPHESKANKYSVTNQEQEAPAKGVLLRTRQA